MIIVPFIHFLPFVKKESKMLLVKHEAQMRTKPAMHTPTCFILKLKWRTNNIQQAYKINCIIRQSKNVNICIHTALETFLVLRILKYRLKRIWCDIFIISSFHLEHFHYNIIISWETIWQYKKEDLERHWRV